MKKLKSKSRYPFFLIALALACSGAEKPRASSDGASVKPEDARMKEGLTLLYEKSDPFGAEQAFRDVLKINPGHYGAHFQLARAIDRGGRPAEARPMWQEVLKSAESMKDTATIRIIQARLAAPDTVGGDAIMAAGLNYLYHLNDPVAAAAEFRKVLERSPNHYGATYQLASALDKSGRRGEARPFWEKVLAMATTYKDNNTAETARTRLKQGP
jgi:Tfp pilus assembly protein PilF